MAEFGKIIVGKMMDEFKAPWRRGGGAEQLSCGRPQEDCFIRKAGRQKYRKKRGERAARPLAKKKSRGGRPILSF